MSIKDAKAHEPSPDVDINLTSSWACAIATSKGGFRGFLFDSKMAELREAQTDSLCEGCNCQPTGLAHGLE
jgi:hypothetical protein